MTEATVFYVGYYFIQMTTEVGRLVLASGTGIGQIDTAHLATDTNGMVTGTTLYYVLHICS